MCKKGISLFLGFIRHTVVKNTIALYGVTFVNYLLPFIAVPYLARVLGPAQLGMVILAHTLGIWLSIIIEYGFSFSTARDVAQNKQDHNSISIIVAGVFGAKIVLVFIAFVITFFLVLFVPTFQKDPIIFWLSFFYCIALGFLPIWYFQGIELLAVPSLINILLKSIGLIPVFIWVKKPEDAWLVMVFQTVAAFLSTMVLVFWMYRAITPLWPKFSWIKKAFHSGFYLFLFSLAGSVYSTANVLILGLFVSPAQVGYYGGAEKIHRAFSSVFGPIGQSFYPYIIRMLKVNKPRGVLIAQKTLLLMIILGIIMGLIVGLGAPYWIELFLGDKYVNSVSILLILAIQLPLTAISRILGVQWMLPLNMDRYFSTIVIIAGVLNILLVVLFVPYGGIIGMAWAFILTELFITASMCYVVRNTGIFNLKASTQ